MSTHQALLLDVDAVVEPLVLPAEEGGEGDDDGGQPDQQDHRPHRAEGPRVDVLHLRHRPIPEEAKEKTSSGYSDRGYASLTLLGSFVHNTIAATIFYHFVKIVSIRPRT